MKVTSSPVAKQFEPIDITFTVESLEELKIFSSILNITIKKVKEQCTIASIEINSSHDEIKDVICIMFSEVNVILKGTN